MKNIKFCYIAPFAYLDLIPLNSKMHLVLAHLLTNDVYRAFYKQKSDRGDDIIVDNSAFEFKYPIKQNDLLKIVIDSGIKNPIIVAPDFPYEKGEKTIKSIESTINAIQQLNIKARVMGVPQSQKGDYADWIDTYLKLTSYDEVNLIGMSILGIPNAFCSLTGTDSIFLNRIYASLHLKQNNIYNINKWHHYLGLDLPRELLIQSKIGIVDSCDSSSPFWNAINQRSGYKRYDNSLGGLILGKNTTPVNFEAKYDVEVKSDIEFNINYIENMVKYE